MKTPKQKLIEYFQNTSIGEILDAIEACKPDPVLGAICEMFHEQSAPTAVSERCEIVYTDTHGGLCVFTRKNCTQADGLGEALTYDDFLGYEYPDGSVWGVPMLYEHPPLSSGPVRTFHSTMNTRGGDGATPVRPVAVLFEGDEK